MATGKINWEVWNEKFTAAKSLMQTRSKNRAVLIEVAAQHPLADGVRPGLEFSQRLIEAVRLYGVATAMGLSPVIYVPGSRHQYHEVADQVSLSQAGVAFLKQQGIPPDVLHGDDINARYKGSRGIYNSADECFVAAKYFKENAFKQLWSVVSPAQLLRKALHYIWFGVLSQMYSVPIETAYHDYLREAYDAVPYVREMDPDSQAEHSAWAEQSRLERKPKEVHNSSL